MKTNTTRTLRRMLALLAAFATILTLFALPAYAKSAGGFQYYTEGPYGEDGEVIATITGHKSAINGTLTIPSKLGGYKVWGINDGAFADRKDITKVVVSEGVCYIGSHTFEGCTNLKTLIIADAGIGEYAFGGCTALKTVKITGYKFADCNPEWYWAEEGNDALYNADCEWTHYKKMYEIAQCEAKTRTGACLELTADYDKFKNGDTYHWYMQEGYGFYLGDDTEWEDCAGKTIEGTITSNGDKVVVCEVTNKKGDVVWAEEFHIHARRSLFDAAESAVYDSYVYGVSDFTVNHFRWKLMDMLDKMGFDVYGV